MTSSRPTSSAQSANCTYSPAICLNVFLDKVEKIDDLTVAFTLKQKLSTFATIYLPVDRHREQGRDRRLVRPLPRGSRPGHRGRDQGVPGRGRRRGGRSDRRRRRGRPADRRLSEVHGRRRGAPDQGRPVRCPTRRRSRPKASSMRALRAGSHLARAALDTTFTADAIDALAAAYKYLDFQFQPVGTGPFKFVDYSTGELIEMRGQRGLLRRAPRHEAAVLPDHQGRPRRWSGAGHRARPTGSTR